MKYMLFALFVKHLYKIWEENKSGSTKSGFVKCKSINTPKIDNLTKQLNIFLSDLLAKIFKGYLGRRSYI